MISFIETKLFTRLVQDYLSDDEYAALQQALLADPEAGGNHPKIGRHPQTSLGCRGTREAGWHPSHLYFSAPGTVRFGCLRFTPRMWRRTFLPVF